MAGTSTARIDEEQFYDPRWRLSNLYHIMDEKGRRVQFRPNDAQLQFLEELHSRNIILKARQLGFTTVCCLIYLDACIFQPNTRAGVIAHKLDDAKVIFRDRIKYPYDQLDDGLKATVKAVQDSVDTLTFANNSSVRVSTSMRSGTLQYLHVSEFGKLCAQFPERAREVVTGTLNTVHAGQFIVIESTAEGQEGAFYRMVQTAREHTGELSPLDYRFHFFPWFEDRKYRLDPRAAVVGADDERYFESLHQHGIGVSPEQKAWYVKTEALMGGDMKREYPSTPDEAFEQALEGAYFSGQIAAAYKQGRIGAFPVDPRYVVNTYWDLGRNDFNTIWFHQFIAGYHRFVGYYENSGEFIGHYIKWIRDWAEERDVTFGEHNLPHDGDRESLWLEGGTLQVMDKLRFRPRIIERPANKAEQISQARAMFAHCVFDEVGCAEGLRRLKAYRKEWDDLRGVWKDKPRHDDASHAADGYMTFSSSVPEYVEVAAERFAEEDEQWRDAMPSGRNEATGY